MSINLHLKTKQKAPEQTQRRLGQWAKLIAITGSAQVIVQAIGFISGILVIRLLPTHEYALYTLANTMLGTMTLLADGGIATGVMSQGGKVWQDQQKLGAVLVTGMQLRKKFALFSLIVATPVLFYLLRKHDASWLMSGLIILSLIPAFFTSLSGTLLEIAPKLQQDIAPLQKIQVLANIGRLALLGLMLFVYPFAAVAIASAGGSQIWSNWRLRKISTCYADRTQSADPEVRKEILHIVKRIMPGAVYYSISGQITIWLLSIFGSTAGIAQVGALSRLSMALNLFSVVLGILVIPRFARLPNNRKLLFTYYFKILAGFIGISLIIIALAEIYTTEVLSILGKDYADLDTPALLVFTGISKLISNFDLTLFVSPVVLMATGSCAGLIAGTAFSLNSTRGFVVPPLFSIPFNLISQIIFLLIFDISQVVGVLAVSFLVNIFQAFMHVVFFGTIIFSGTINDERNHLHPL